MAITSLSEVQNDYGSYRGNSLVGELGNVGTVPNDGLENIVGKPYPFLNGIILNIGGVLYTDSGYLNALKAAGNPYISKRSLPTVPLQLSDLTTLSEDIKVYGSGSDEVDDDDDDGTVYRTQYAEANVTKRMNTVDDVLKYLNDFLNPNTTDTVLTTSTIGSWELTTSTYSSELDVNGLYPGLEFEAYEDIASPSSVTKPSTPPTETEPKNPEPVIIAEVPEEPEIEIIPFIPEPTEPISIIPPLILTDIISPINIGTGGTSGGSRFFRDRVRFDEPDGGRFLNGGFDGQDTLRVSDEMEGFLF